MKFEVGNEYICQRGELRIRVVAVNEWGAAFEHMAGVVAGQFGHCPHCDHHWRPAPRVVERWIVESDNGGCSAFGTEGAARFAAQAVGRGTIVAGPFKIEVPW